MMMRVYSLTILLALCASAAHAQPPRPIEFNRDVRPILSDACFQCHGPDKQKRKAKLHFDTEEGARAAFVGGKPDESEMIRRILSTDKTERMPPPSAAVTLTAKQIDTLKEWVRQGAKWQKHWAFIPPTRQPLPAAKNKTWPKNAIDHFVLARLEAEGLQPSPEADAATLIRRLSLDLTGLPPTPAEVDAFVKEYASAKPQAAYEALVDRLLASPRYGERMAMPWLNAARYADTNGYQTDGERVMWRWRDWVIDAFNTNMSFDRFTVEQLAGDLVPNATLEQKIATGFNRNHRGNSEGGVIPEEYAVEYVVDRVDTTSTVWLGLSAGCARCHDHKYDPLSQKEFYQLYAYFNNVPERGKAIKYGNSPPYIQSPTREQQKQWKALLAKLSAAESQCRVLDGELGAAQTKWEQALERKPIAWTYSEGLSAHFPLKGTAEDLRSGKKGRFISGRRQDPEFAEDYAAFFQEGRYLDAGDVADFGFFDKFSIGAWVNASRQRAGTIFSRMADTDRGEGFSVSLDRGVIYVHLVKRWLDDAIRIETVATGVPRPAIEPDWWSHVMVTYDGSREAKGVQIYINGKPQQIKVNLDDLNQSFKTKEPFRIGGGSGPESRFYGLIHDVRVYDVSLPADDVAMIAESKSIRDIVDVPAEKRTKAQSHKVRTYFLEHHAPAEIRKAHEHLKAVRKQVEQLDETIPTTMVMQEMPTPRQAFILLRGEYDKPGPKVDRAVPSALPALPKGAPNNRLGLAQWLVARENPLTARVAVNRYWQMLFGAGIVRSVEDFGAQGDWPSHPELLDWLAVEFMEPMASRERKRRESFDTKRLLKLIVTSATYRQSSRVTPALLQRDPDNRLLARGPRVRLSADIIRDQALFAAGLLVEKQGGPSVRPYQPAGLVKELTGTEEYEQDHGEKLYRRSLYTFWKRTVPPPAMMNLDAANRETCVVRESRTNTPLQALNLMNDVTFVEAARVLAERVMKSETDPASRLALAWRLAANRTPSDPELKLLRDSLERHRAHYQRNRAAAVKLINAGEHPRDQKLDVAEHAAYTAVCNLILNLDEVITKE